MYARVVVIVALILVIELLERSAFYGMKAILKLSLIDHLGMDRVSATDWIHRFNWIVYGTPFLGALAGVAVGPRFALVIASLIASAGFALLSPLQSTEATAVALMVLGTGTGMMKPCVVAALADAIPDPRESLRNLAFVGFYLAINVAAFVSTILAPWAYREGHASAVFAAGAVLLLAVAVLALTGALSWRLLPGPLPQEPSGPDRWWRAALGAAGIGLLLVPYYVTLDLGSSAAFSTGTSPPPLALRLSALNPAFVLGSGVPLLLALAAALALGFRARALLGIGVGMALTALVSVPALLAPEAPWSFALTLTGIASVEALVGGLALARIASGHHWRLKPVFGCVTFAAIPVANLIIGIQASLPEELRPTGFRVTLAASLLATLAIGAALAAAHRPLSRVFWPEEERAA